MRTWAPEPQLHVCHVLEATGGGAGKHLELIVGGLRKTGVSIDLVLSPCRADADFEAVCSRYRELGCTVHLLPLRTHPGIGDVAAMRHLRRILADRSPRILHSHCAKAGMVGRMAARPLRHRVSTVHTPHSFFFQGLSPLLRRAGIAIERQLGRWTDRLVCVSEAEAEVARRARLLPHDRIRVIPNGLPEDFAETLLDRTAARNALGLAPDRFAIGMFARLDPRKRHAVLLHAVAGLAAEQRHRSQVILVGTGSCEPSLRRCVARLGLQDTVRFAGYRPRAERFLKGLDLAVLPSAYEGCAYQLLEALAAGIPFVASDVCGNRPPHPDNPVRYVARDEVGELTAAIAEVMDDADLRDRMRHAGPPWVNRHFPLERQMQALRAVYRELACESPGDGRLRP